MQQVIMRLSMTFPAVAVLTAILSTPIAARAADRTTSFDGDWRFHLGDAPGSEAVTADDTGWRKLDLPHDWMIEGVPGGDPAQMEGPFDHKSPGGAGNGYLDGGVGWYRKHFARPAGGHVAVQFDGIYMNSEVWLNGKSLGKHPYGYTSFEYDLTPNLKDGDNVIAVRAEVDQPCSRFYSGAGIYRHVWLTSTGPVHVDHWGTYVTSEAKAGGSAKVTCHTTVRNDSDSAWTGQLTTTVPDPGRVDDRLPPMANDRITVSAHGSVTVDQTVNLASATLWSIERPQMYRAVTAVGAAPNVVDVLATPFGIRTVEFTIDHGMLLNGKHVPLYGVCDHHDLGVLGAAVNTRAIERQLEILKSFGCNAIRTSHYPPTPELLDLCDRMGFLVMDEAFDEWKRNKTPQGYGHYFDEWSERDIVSMVDRDRNHPSVVMWSIGNEIPEQGSKNAEAMAKRLAGFVRREDPTRPITAAQNSPGPSVKNGFYRALDLFGVNYNIGAYTMDAAHGKMPMLGSETASALSSRGEYGLAIDGKTGLVKIQKQQNQQCSDYDVFGPGWGNIAQDALMAMQRDPWMAGEFVWTGFDYIGEPTPYGWPSRSSYFGIVDLCGFPKDRYYLYQSQWTAKPMVHLLPHWNWLQFEGKNIPVWCYTNADAVELFLNGKSLGEKTVAGDKVKLHLEWSVPYAAGTLKAVAKKGGQIVATDEVVTAGKPAKLTISADHAALKPGVRDLSFVTVGMVDAEGHKCPLANDAITYTLTGPATIAGAGNGDATNHESFTGNRHKLFNGLGLVVLQATDQPGTVTLKATADGVEPATVTVNVGG